jgi:hypothetical protein
LAFADTQKERRHLAFAAFAARLKKLALKLTGIKKTSRF